MSHTNAARAACGFSTAQPSDSEWLPNLTFATDGTPRLFCFSYAGGSAEIFRQWQSPLKSKAQICPMEMPGRGRRFTEPYSESIETAALQAAEAIASLNPAPYYLFGHSMGTIMALETARHLQALRAKPPRALIVSGRYPPHAQTVKRSFHTASEEAIVDELRRLGGTPEEILLNDDFRNAILPIVRDDFRLVETYDPKVDPILDIPVFACCGEDDEDTPYSVMKRWGEISSKACSVTQFNGGHFYITNSRQELLSHLESILQSAV